MTFPRSFIRTISIHYNLFSGWDSFNHIADGIMLGMIPIKAATVSTLHNNMEDKIIEAAAANNPERPLKSVISVVEPDELQGEGFWGVRMTSPADWRKKGIAHHLLNMPDFTATVSNKSAIETIFIIREAIEKSGTVYIHCKAGRSRSVMICAIYLATFGLDPLQPEMTPLENIIDYLRKKRLQMDLDKNKIAKAEEIISEIRAIMDRLTSLKDALPDLGVKTLNLIDEYLGENDQTIDEEKNEDIQSALNMSLRKSPLSF